MLKFNESPDKYSMSYADPGSVLYLVSFPDFGDSLELLAEPGTTLAEAEVYARGRYGGERMVVSMLRDGVNSAKHEPKREIAGSATGLYLADLNPTKTKRSALGLKATGETKIKGADMTWTASVVDVYSPFDAPGLLRVMDASRASMPTGQWQATRQLSRAERDAGVKSPRVVIVRNKAGHTPRGAAAPKGSIDLWEFHPTTAARMTQPRIADWKGTASQLLKHYDRIQAKKLGLPEPGLKKAAKKKGKKKAATGKLSVRDRDLKHRGPVPPGYKPWGLFRGDKLIEAFDLRREAEAAKKEASKKKPAKKKATKRARPKADDEIRLLKRSGKLIATFGVTYKLTQAMEDIRDCARRSKPCKVKIVIRAYDQLRAAGKTPGKTPRQGLAYYVAAELAKDLRRSPELKAIGKGDHPKFRPA